MHNHPPVLTARESAEAHAMLREVRRDHRQKYNASVATFRPLDGFVLFEREPLPDRAANDPAERFIEAGKAVDQ